MRRIPRLHAEFFILSFNYKTKYRINIRLFT